MAVCALAALTSLCVGVANAGATQVPLSTSAAVSRGAPSSGCGARAQKGSTTLTLEIGGHQRTVCLLYTSNEVFGMKFDKPVNAGSQHYVVCAAVRALEPVSYTHLDVYKRQAL